ncbi:hypothetical protein M1E11_10690 [Bacillus sp. JZ8]
MAVYSGPTVGEFLLSSQLPLQLNFLAFAIPCSIGAIAIRLIQEKYSQTTIRITNESFNTREPAANPERNSI